MTNINPSFLCTHTFFLLYRQPSAHTHTHPPEALVQFLLCHPKPAASAFPVIFLHCTLCTEMLALKSAALCHCDPSLQPKNRNGVNWQENC